MSALEITKVVFFCTLTLWLGFCALGGMAFILDPLALPLAVHLPKGSTRAIGALMGLGVIAYLVGGGLRREPFRLLSMGGSRYPPGKRGSSRCWWDRRTGCWPAAP